MYDSVAVVCRKDLPEDRLDNNERYGRQRLVAYTADVFGQTCYIVKQSDVELYSVGRVCLPLYTVVKSLAITFMDFDDGVRSLYDVFLE